MKCKLCSFRKNVTKYDVTFALNGGSNPNLPSRGYATGSKI